MHHIDMIFNTLTGMWYMEHQKHVKIEFNLINFREGFPDQMETERL